MLFLTTLPLTDIQEFRIQKYEHSYKNNKVISYDVEYVLKISQSAKIFTFNSEIAAAEILAEINRFLGIN